MHLCKAYMSCYCTYSLILSSYIVDCGFPKPSNSYFFGDSSMYSTMIHTCQQLIYCMREIVIWSICWCTPSMIFKGLCNTHKQYLNIIFSPFRKLKYENAMKSFSKVKCPTNSFSLKNVHPKWFQWNIDATPTNIPQTVHYEWSLNLL